MCPWEIETNFRHLKSTMGMDPLKCRSVDGVMKELMIFVLVYGSTELAEVNLIRAAMTAAAGRQDVDANRVSFIDALRWLCACGRAAATRDPVHLIVNPLRIGRWHARVLKRRIKPYDLMNRPRREYLEPTAPKEVIA